MKQETRKTKESGDKHGRSGAMGRVCSNRNWGLEKVPMVKKAKSGLKGRVPGLEGTCSDGQRVGTR